MNNKDWTPTNEVEDIAKALIANAYGDMGDETDAKKQRIEVEEALYYLKACAQNPYNKGYFREFYDLLDQIADNYQRSAFYR